MRPRIRIITSIIILGCFLSLPVKAGISQTVHNLSISGPGTIKSSQDRICVFCHTPHNANPATPLWNHELSAQAYTMYESRSLNYNPADYSSPTGSSKLCLSCHDGTVAIGAVNGNTYSMSGTDPDGTITSATNLGIDLSDDHPVSVPVVETNELWAPEQHGLSSEVRLENNLVECSSCHDAHSSTYEDFLVLDKDGGVLCKECHHQDGWETSAHGPQGPAASTNWTDPDTNVTKTMAEWACLGCHDIHKASEQELLQDDGDPVNSKLEQVCYRCHDGSAAPAIEQEFYKTYSHPVQNISYDGVHYPTEPNPPSETHIECTDCHDPHYGQAGARQLGDDSAGGMLAGIQAPQVGPGSYPETPWTPPNYGTVHEITYEYELCLKCHGTVSDMQLSNDHKEEIDVYFNPNNYATHGCIVPGGNRNPYVVSGFREELGWTATTTIACCDCHGNDETGTSRISGPHGSNNDWLLRESGIADNHGNSTVCYLCHDEEVYGKFGNEGSRSAFPAHTKGGHWNRQPDYPPGVPPIGCFVCHGDFSRQLINGYTAGGLHGANSGRAERPSTTRGAHFLNGFGIEIYSSESELLTPGATITCGDYYNTDNGFGCDKHSKTSYTRPNY